MKKITHVLSAPLALCLMALTACEEKKVVTVTDGPNGTTTVTTTTTTPAATATHPVVGVLQSQIAAMNREDLATFMSYIHPDNPKYSETESATRKLFDEYELKTTLEKAEDTSVTDGEAKIKFVQLTQKVTGPAFRDNRVTGVHTLRQDKGVWKIFATEASGVVYLDGAL